MKGTNTPRIRPITQPRGVASVIAKIAITFSTQPTAAAVISANPKRPVVISFIFSFNNDDKIGDRSPLNLINKDYRPHRHRHHHPHLRHEQFLFQSSQSHHQMPSECTH